MENTIAEQYYCPMGCEGDKTYDEPGSCPKCGMNLVPDKGEETSDEEKAYKKITKKFWIALALSIPVFIIAMSEFFKFLHLGRKRNLVPHRRSKSVRSAVHVPRPCRILKS